MVRSTPKDDNDRTLLADVERHGWHLVGIKGQDDDPGYVFSVGLFHTFSKPEVCIFGLRDTQVMGQILNQVGELLKSGEEYKDWDSSDDVLEGYSCIFRQVDSRHYALFFGYARWFYEDNNFPMIKVVWPDAGHCFPWDSDFDSQLVEAQPILAINSHWPFLEPKNTAVISTRQVIAGVHPVLVVSHDDDGDWQFLCGTTNREEDGREKGLLEKGRLSRTLQSTENDRFHDSPVPKKRKKPTRLTRTGGFKLSSQTYSPLRRQIERSSVF
ncbi:MAG: DUF4262 domain-containing protein [Planctomycetota bacterium]